MAKSSMFSELSFHTLQVLHPVTTDAGGFVRLAKAPYGLHSVRMYIILSIEATSDIYEQLPVVYITYNVSQSASR